MNNKETDKTVKNKNMTPNQEMSPEEVKKEIAKWIAALVIGLAAGMILKTFVVISAHVPTGSMETTVMTGDRMLGNRLAYLWNEPKRGDVVIFKYPDNEEELFIKRVIGLPGDTVMVVDGKVYINCSLESLDEPYLPQEMIGTFGPYEVPEGHYFMMGDNRNYSLDSRFWINTYVSRDEILGKAWFKFYPGIGLIKYRDYEYQQ